MPTDLGDKFSSINNQLYTAHQTTDEAQLARGFWWFNDVDCTLTQNGITVGLTRTECWLLSLLAFSSERVISKEVLEPLYDPSMIYDNGASRIGKGLHWQIKCIKQQLARHYRKYGRAGGVLLLDLKKFFPYAPHSIIYQRHQRYILNPDFRRIADTIIDTAPGEFPAAVKLLVLISAVHCHQMTA